MAKILIVRLGAMGDILHALPAVTGIRRALPDAVIGWLIEERWTDLLAPGKEQPLVNFVHSINTRRLRNRFWDPSVMGEFGALIKSMRSVHYDVALDFQGAIKSAILESLSGAACKVGFVNPREPAARIFYSVRFSRKGEHVIEQNHGLAMQALQRIGQNEIQLLAPQLPCDPVAEAWAIAEIRRLGIAGFAIMNPGAGWTGKQWPAERYGQVARALAVHNLTTLVNAAPGEESLAQKVVEASGGKAFTISCSIGQLIALTRRARLFIGPDTGPLHLAAALQVPVVGLFGPTDPVRTGPFGTRSAVLRHPESKTTFSHHKEPDQGLLKITAEETIAAARRLLGSSDA